MASTHEKVVRPDAKGRISLGTLATGISSFVVKKDAQNRIILEPFVEIPAREKWLFDNKQALAQIKKGLQDAAKGRLQSRGSFQTYQDENLDE